MGPDAEDLRAERGRKPSLQSRLQSGRYHSEYYHFSHDPVIVSLVNEISVIFRKVEASIYERKVIEPSEISLMFRFLKFIDGWMNEVVTKRVSGFLVSDLVNKGEVFLFSRNRSDTVSN